MSSSSMLETLPHSKSSSTPPITDFTHAEKVWDDLCWNTNSYVLQNWGLKMEYDQILKSRPAECGVKIIELCNCSGQVRSEIDQRRQVAIIQILLGIGKHFKLDTMALQTALVELGKMDWARKTSTSCVWESADLDSPIYKWTEVMSEAQTLYALKLKEHIQGLGGDFEIIQFASMQHSLQSYGVKLMNHWSPEVQRAVFLTWVPCINLYTRSNDQMKRIVEIQVAYVYSTQKALNELTPSYINQGCLNHHKDELLSHIDSIPEHEFWAYLSLQDDLPYYNIRPFVIRSNKESKKVLRFWINYMCVYIGAKSVQGMESIGAHIEDLMMDNPRIIEEHLNKFLDPLNHPSHNNLELAMHFIEYLAGETESSEIRTHCNNALVRIGRPKQMAKDFRLDSQETHPKQNHKDKSFSKKVFSMMTGSGRKSHPS